ncbi:hypothetical protein D9V32_07840 [Mycetocola tolaasinivorans]|uniref:Uncharacterized protein n=1 Tax=Mycetocola tolaasinivorans TaxID=76635 RepID=A0A3L7A6W7_9MICO|nr:hypothetical protein [Mycetocola tolaasinivorans]RLP76059.1 hypothetical protein D9V32_07840 [Mycetocola tolaasinivorans]
MPGPILAFSAFSEFSAQRFFANPFNQDYARLSDMPLWLLILTIGIGAILGVGGLWLHHWLSVRNPVWLGAIIPAIVVIFAITPGKPENATWGDSLGRLVLVVPLLIMWWGGERKRRIRRGEDPDGETPDTQNLPDPI